MARKKYKRKYLGVLGLFSALCLVVGLAYLAGNIGAMLHQNGTLSKNPYDNKTDSLKQEELLRKLRKEKSPVKETISIDKSNTHTPRQEKNQTTQASGAPKNTPHSRSSKLASDKKNAQASSYLVIIIDDVTSKRQIRLIERTGLALTPSIFPPNRQNPKSHLLARLHPHAMIHLPLESGSHKLNRQRGTLFRSHTQEEISQAIASLRRQFPSVRYVNNHTGSRFTSDVVAMKRLLRALKRHRFEFVDSVTHHKSVARKVARQEGISILRRDVFLDNIRKTDAIRKQLKKAVRIARKRGYAIAIGHPYRVTLQTLSRSKDILKGVEVVYLDRLKGVL